MEIDFRKIVSGKAGISLEDIEEMIAEYKALHSNNEGSDEHKENVIFYNDFVAMLQ